MHREKRKFKISNYWNLTKEKKLFLKKPLQIKIFLKGIFFSGREKFFCLEIIKKNERDSVFKNDVRCETYIQTSLRNKAKI